MRRKSKIIWKRKEKSTQILRGILYVLLFKYLRHKEQLWRLPLRRNRWKFEVYSSLYLNLIIVLFFKIKTFDEAAI
jgi:hypothetical protein